MNYKNSLLLSIILLSSGLIFGMKNNDNCENKKLYKFEYFKQLPKDIQKEVIKYFSFKNVKNFRLTNKLLKGLIDDEDFKKQRNIANKLGLELIDAIDKKNHEKAEYIINSGHANLDVKDKNKQYDTALMRASNINNIKIAKLLIENAADLTLKNEDNWTVLMWAANSGKPEIMTLLIEAKVEINSQDSYNWTPLMWASSCGEIEAVKLLIKAKANTYLKNTHGKSALDLAITDEIKNIIKRAMENKK